MKNVLLTLSLPIFLSVPALAHDKGHGPKIVKSGKYGGLLTKVSEASDRASAKKAKPLYAAEFVKDNDGKIFVYLYSKEMEPVSLDGLSNFKGVVESGRGKRAKSQEVSLNAKGLSITGQLPNKIKRPFNIKVTFKKGKKNLFMAFDNLD